MTISNLVDLICFEATGGGDAGSGGTGEKNPNEEKPDTVARDAYERVLDEAKAAKAKLRQIEDEKRSLVEAEAKKRGDTEALLKIREDELAAEREARAAEAAEKETLKQERIHDRKVRSFFRGLGQPLDERWHGLVDLDQIKIDENGKPVEASVTQYVKDFQTRYGSILGKPGTGNVPNVKAENNAGVSIWETGVKIDRSNLKEAREQMEAAYAAEMAAKRKA